MPPAPVTLRSVKVTPAVCVKVSGTITSSCCEKETNLVVKTSITLSLRGVTEVVEQVESLFIVLNLTSMDRLTKSKTLFIHLLLNILLFLAVTRKLSAESGKFLLCLCNINATTRALC
jgi:hypothetical protein